MQNMKTYRYDSQRIYLVPLIDTLFSVLFFYMAFSFFSVPSPARQIPVKKVMQSKAQVQKTARVWVKEGGEVFVNGNLMQKAQMISFFSKNKNQFIFVSVGGDGNARVEEIQTVIHWLKSSGVTKISFHAK